MRTEEQRDVRSDLVGECLGEAAEAEVDLAKRLAGGEEVPLGKVLDGDVVVDPQPAKRLDVLAAALVDVADDVGPARLLLPAPLHAWTPLGSICVGLVQNRPELSLI